MRITLGMALLFSGAAGAACAAPAPSAPPSGLVVPKDGMVLTKNAKLKPGVYALPKGIRLGADGITLDGNGAVFVGNGTGQAVQVKGWKNCTVRNLRAQRYTWGIVIDKASNPSVLDCRIRDTAEERPDDVWLDIWKRPEDPYGAAILLRDVDGGRIAGNDVQHQQNGISMYNTRDVTVEKNNASFESGWGIHLWQSSSNVIQDNLADWCNRIQKRGERAYYPGADASGLLMIYNSSKNTVRRNFFRGGGDGVFVAGYHPPEKVPCNDNLFEDNDCSLSPNNAFEATFCRGNIFRNNRASQSNYGFWLGYSWENKIEGNEVRRNRIAGVAIEHGYRNEIDKNIFFANSRGVALWAKAQAGWLDAYPENKTSAFYDIHDNTFSANGVGLLSKVEGEPKGTEPHDYTVHGNTFYGNEVGALFMNTLALDVRGNRFQKNSITGLRLEGSTGTAAGNAFMDQDTPAWSDTPITWTASDSAPAGNYWQSAKAGTPFAVPGPNAGTDTAPLAEIPASLAPPAASPSPRGMGQWTEMDILRSTPR